MKGLSNWISLRFPFQRIWRTHISEYYTPKNFNIWYFFGSLALFVLVNQIITGIWLTMYYTPTVAGAFDSIEYIMRDVNYGWLLRYLHSTGASAFFLVVYLHMFRSLLYGSYKSPREVVWILGMLLYTALMAEAFFGYLLPWGQMSFWGAQVITSLFGAVPFVGKSLMLFLRGDFNVADATLHRFFSLHVIAVPLFLCLLVWMHIIALHEVGSNNPDGLDINKLKDESGKPVDGIPFHPYYTVKNIWGLVVFLIVFLGIVFFFPTMGGYFLEHANFLPANPLSTPDHIAPVWYLTPFYSILRAVPDKLMGVCAMAGSIAILYALPWLDRSPVRSIRYRGIFSKIALSIFVISFVGLGYLGTINVTPLRQYLAQLFCVLYFAFFLLMPFYTRFEKTKPVPTRVT